MFGFPPTHRPPWRNIMKTIKPKITLYVLQNPKGKYLSKGDSPNNVWAYNQTDIINAKQWKTKVGADRALNYAITEQKKLISKMKEEQRKKWKQYYVESRKKTLEELKEIKVIELKVEADDLKPNYFSDNKHVYGKRFNDGSKATRRTTCNTCGLILKNIPHVTINLYNARAKVCCFCVERINEDIKLLSSKMDSKLKDAITQEHFLREL